LRDFRDVDLRKIVRVDLIFDKTPRGAVFLSDVRFSPATN
jgi:D-alanine-D-alanine ligase-like ATP-grasp enzyme